MHSIVSILTTLLGVSSLITAAPASNPAVVARGICDPGTYECGSGDIEIWVCDPVAKIWTPAASCGWGNHCEEVQGIPACFPGPPVF